MVAKNVKQMAENAKNRVKYVKNPTKYCDVDYQKLRFCFVPFVSKVLKIARCFVKNEYV